MVTAKHNGVQWQVIDAHDEPVHRYERLLEQGIINFEEKKHSLIFYFTDRKSDNWSVPKYESNYYDVKHIGWLKKGLIEQKIMNSKLQLSITIEKRKLRLAKQALESLGYDTGSCVIDWKNNKFNLKEKRKKKEKNWLMYEEE